MNNTAIEWVSGSDTGLSSTVIWRHMMELDPVDGTWGISVPLDPDDFGRCYRLLLLIPEWRLRLGEMAQYPSWAPLIKVWAEMTRLYEQDIDMTGERHTGSSADLYKLMHDVRDA